MNEFLLVALVIIYLVITYVPISEAPKGAWQIPWLTPHRFIKLEGVMLNEVKHLVFDRDSSPEFILSKSKELRMTPFRQPTSVTRRWRLTICRPTTSLESRCRAAQ